MGTTQPTSSDQAWQQLPPYVQMPSQRQPPPPPPGPSGPGKPRTTLKVSLTAAGALVVGLMIGAAANGGSAQTASRAAPVAPTPQTVYMTAPAPPAVTVTETPQAPPPPGPLTSFSDGIYEIGPDIVPGKYKTPGPGSSGVLNSCYKEVSNGTGQVSGIIQNDNLSGPGVVTLPNGKYFKTNGGCTWTKVG